MKIGFSLGRCVRDIVRGDISIDDVAFIIAATNIRDEAQLANVINNYMYEPTYLADLDVDQCQEVAHQLWTTNRILQPRREGLYRHAQPENAVWVDMFPTKPTANENVRRAWDNYRLMLNMVENVDTDALEAFK